jgi:hypothetical protein
MIKNSDKQRHSIARLNRDSNTRSSNARTHPEGSLQQAARHDTRRKLPPSPRSQHSQSIRSPATRLDELKLDRVVKAPQRIRQAQQSQPNERRLPRLASRLAARRAASGSLQFRLQSPVQRHQAVLRGNVLQGVDARPLFELGDLEGHVRWYGDDGAGWWQAASAFGWRGWCVDGAHWD